MNIKPRWRCFIILAVAQVTLLMVGLKLLFGWMDHARIETLRTQVFDNTRSTALGLISQFKQQNLRDFRNTSGQPDGESLQVVRSLIDSIFVPNDGFVCLLDNQSGDVICDRWMTDSANSMDIAAKPFADAADAEHAVTSIANVFADVSTRGNKAATGTLSSEHETWWLAAHFVPQLDAILVVAQPQSVVMAVSDQQVASAKARMTPLAAIGCLLAILTQLIAFTWFEEKFESINTGLERKVTNNERELVRTRNAVIFGLAKLAESRDNDTGEHLERIRQYVEILCSDLVHVLDDIKPEMLHDISLASSLHDIGKVGIPDSILLKPGRLTPEEREVMQIHTLIGGECLDAIHARLGDNTFMDIARQIAYYHHERWDGNGYPHGLAGDEIPLVARVVAVADVYDALTSKRPYKRAMDHLESKTIIVSGSGTQFDPEVVAAFLRHEDKFEEISRSQQNVSDEEATSKCARLHGLVGAGQPA